MTMADQHDEIIDDLQAKIEAADTVASCLQEAIDELWNLDASPAMIADFERALFAYDHAPHVEPVTIHAAPARVTLPSDFDVVAR